jgi:hypothetical protein
MIKPLGILLLWIALAIRGDFADAGNGSSKQVQEIKSPMVQSAGGTQPREFFSTEDWNLRIRQIVERSSPFKINQRLEQLYLNYQFQLNWQQVEVLLDSLISNVQISTDSPYSKESVELRLISQYFSIYFVISLNPNLNDFQAMRDRFHRVSSRVEDSVQHALMNRYHENKTEFELASSKLEVLDQFRGSFVSNLVKSFHQLEKMNSLAQVLFQKFLEESHLFQKVVELDQLLVSAMNELRKIEVRIERMEQLLLNLEKSEIQAELAITRGKILVTSCKDLFTNPKKCDEYAWLDREGQYQGMTQALQESLDDWKKDNLKTAHQILKNIQSISQKMHRHWTKTQD